MIKHHNFNCLSINLDIENKVADHRILVTSNLTVDHLVIKANHSIEKIIMLTLEEKFIEGYHVKSPDFVLNLSSAKTDMCLIMILFTGLPDFHSLLLI